MAEHYEELSEVDREVALLIRAKYPIISVVTHEEWRVLAQLEGIRKHVIEARTKQLQEHLARAGDEAERADLQRQLAALPQAHQVLRWSIIDGLWHWSSQETERDVAGQVSQVHRPRPLDLSSAFPNLDTRHPIELLLHLRRPPDQPVDGVDLRTALYVFCDLHIWLDREDRAGRFNHVLVRALRDLAYLFKNNREPSALILLSPRSVVPVELNKEIQVIDYPLPTVAQLEQYLERLFPDMQRTYGADCIQLNQEEQRRLMHALCGLTYAEAENVLAKSLADNGLLQPDDIADALEEKRQIIKKDGTLEYFDSDKSLEDVGGLDALLEWLQRRRQAFEGEVVEYSQGGEIQKIPLPTPKGILMIGVPGCGKSLVAKAVAKTWELPLLRLDIGRIFGGTVGQSEENMRRAIRIAQSVAPAVLWLDEVEKAFPKTTGASDAGTSLRVMNTFLTWLQEKKEPVFVVATGNDIQQVPPELTRKGRFDEIFYVGLPDQKARRAILEIHTRDYPLQHSDYEALAKKSQYFTGAEIEQCIKAALFRLPVIGGFASPPKEDVPTAPLPRAIFAEMHEFVPLARREEHGDLILAETLRRAETMAVPASRNFEDLPKKPAVGAHPIQRPVWGPGRFG